MNRIKLCFVGLGSLPVLASGFEQHRVGGEEVQQSLLAKAFAARGLCVSMVAGDFGQPNESRWHDVTVYKAYNPTEGLPVIRFLYPRWVKMWRALRMANADVYYTSCAGMQVGLLASFCKRYNKKFVYRIAHDSDCEPKRLLIRSSRDRHLYEFGLRRADAILAQSERQQVLLRNNYGLQSTLSAMLVDAPSMQLSDEKKDIDVLWVANIRKFKRPDLILRLARRLAAYQFHLVGGRQPGHEQLYEDVQSECEDLNNVTFHGHVPYQHVGELYARSRVLVNTSDEEGFPNSYLQAWVNAMPVVAMFDPDEVIARENLGRSVTSLDDMALAVQGLLVDSEALNGLRRSCETYMTREYSVESVLAPYAQKFADLMDGRGGCSP